MKYLYTFLGDFDEQPSPEQMKEGLERWAAFDREATEAGVLIACEPVDGSDSALTIRVASDGSMGDPVDGPFAESKEQLGGFCLLEVADRDEALDWATRIPLRPDAAMEIRPITDLSQFGYESSTVSPAKAKATA
jgi:hypothetical protein